MNRLWLLLAFAGAVLFAGCASSSDKLPPPKSSSTLILGPDDRQVLRTVPLQGELRVLLPNPEEGPAYNWVIVSNNVLVMRQTVSLHPAPNATPKQAFVAVFQAIHPGRSILRFAAVKPGQSESEPDDLYQVAIGVRDQ